MIKRSPRHVAARTLILAAIGLRGALEQAVEPRAAEMAARLPRWLADEGLASQIDPLEQEQLHAPLGKLTPSQRVDTRAAVPAAWWFCWALGLADEPAPAYSGDLDALLAVVPVLRKSAGQFLDQARLRPEQDIAQNWIQTVLLRSLLQEQRIPADARPTLRRINTGRLSQAGLAVTESDEQTAARCFAAMPDKLRGAASGLAFVRDVAAAWMFSARTRYFAD